MERDFLGFPSPNQKQMVGTQGVLEILYLHRKWLGLGEHPFVSG